jgi:hypothetical protein
METTVFCPDCGGVIGGRSPDGVKLCTCDTKPAGPLPGMPNPADKPKVCCRCGKDLHGKKRFKDSLGYWCEACHYSEKRQEMQDHVPCDACGRYVEKHKLAEYEGTHICSRCVKERQRAGKKKRRPVAWGSEHKEHERRTLLTLAAVAAVLLIIIILASLGLLPGWM